MLIFNPLKEDFVYPWYDDDNLVQTITLPSMEITRLPEAQGKFMLRHLADRVFQESGDSKKDRDLEYKRIYSELEINDGLD